MITELTTEAVAVEVPDYPKHLCPYLGSIRNSLMYWSGNKLQEQPLSEGNWEILGRAASITETQAAEIVERWNIDDGCDPYIWADYLSAYGDCLATAVESFQSLLKSKNLNPESVIILTKKQ